MVRSGRFELFLWGNVIISSSLWLCYFVRKRWSSSWENLQFRQLPKWGSLWRCIFIEKTIPPESLIIVTVKLHSVDIASNSCCWDTHPFKRYCIIAVIIIKHKCTMHRAVQIKITFCVWYLQIVIHKPRFTEHPLVWNLMCVYLLTFQTQHVGWGKKHLVTSSLYSRHPNTKGPSVFGAWS